MTDAREILLTVDGAVESPLRLTFADLEKIDASYQLFDIGRTIPGRQGDALLLTGLLSLARPHASANYLGLHSSLDDFHASIPLEPIRDRAILIYRLHGVPLERGAGGPIRFFIPHHAACHTDEIDECANVKFVERLELTLGKGFDNRPRDEADHAALHSADRSRREG